MNDASAWREMGACTCTPAQTVRCSIASPEKKMSTQQAANDRVSTTWKRNESSRAALEVFLARSKSAAGRPEPLTLAERIERMEGAMAADQLAKLLNVSKITIFKQAKAGRIPSFRIGTCVRFDPRTVAKWLRTQ
jgi:excisionase family DNA binding protein